MINFIPRHHVTNQPLFQQEVSAHGIGDDRRDLRIDEFHEGVATRASGLGRARDATAIDAAKLIEKDSDLAFLKPDGEMAEVDDR